MSSTAIMVVQVLHTPQQPSSRPPAHLLAPAAPLPRPALAAQPPVVDPLEHLRVRPWFRPCPAPVARPAPLVDAPLEHLRVRPWFRPCPAPVARPAPFVDAPLDEHLMIRPSDGAIALFEHIRVIAAPPRPAAAQPVKKKKQRPRRSKRGSKSNARRGNARKDKTEDRCKARPQRSKERQHGFIVNPIYNCLGDEIWTAPESPPNRSSEPEGETEPAERRRRRRRRIGESSSSP